MLFIGCKDDKTGTNTTEDCGIEINRLDLNLLEASQVQLDLYSLYDKLGKPYPKSFEIIGKVDKRHLTLYWTCLKNDSTFYRKELIEIDLDIKYSRKKFNKLNLGVTMGMKTGDDGKIYFEIKMNGFGFGGYRFIEDSVEIAPIGRVRSFSTGFGLLKTCLNLNESTVLYSKDFSFSKSKEPEDYYDFRLIAEFN